MVGDSQGWSTNKKRGDLERILGGAVEHDDFKARLESRWKLLYGDSDPTCNRIQKRCSIRTSSSSVESY